jgi:hypothetical protein
MNSALRVVLENPGSTLREILEWASRA